MNKYRCFLLFVGICMLMISIFGCANRKDNKENTSQEASEEKENDEKEHEKEKSWEDYAEQDIYVDFPKVEAVTESGNTYEFNEEYLGYYTNNYYGIHLKQIDGGTLITDLYFYDYYLTSVYAAVMDQNTFNFEYFYNDGMEDTVVQSGAYNSQYSRFDTNIQMQEDGSFSLDNTAQFQTAWEGCLGQTMGLFYAVDIRFQDVPVIFDYAYGRYERAELPKGKALNSYDPSVIGMEEEYGEYAEGCYYKNTQPLKDRISVESYPKYIKYIPTEKYYIHGGDARKNETFFLMKVMTGADSGEYNMYNKVKAELIGFAYDSDNNQWVNRGYEFGFYNLNYEIPELLGLSGYTEGNKSIITGYEKAETDDVGNGSNGTLQQRHIIMDTAGVEKGEVIVRNDFLNIKALNSKNKEVDVYSVSKDGGEMLFRAITQEDLENMLTDVGLDKSILE